MASHRIVELLQHGFVFLTIGIIVASIHETDAMLFDPGTSGETEYYRILHVEETFMLVGGRNHYYNVSTQSLEIFADYVWYPSESDISFCNGEIVKYGRDCDSYVVSAVKQSNTSYLICASSAKKPVCRKLMMNSEGEWPIATEIVTAVPNPLVPIFPWHEVRKLTTKDTGALHVVGDYLREGAIWCPQLYRDNVYDYSGSEREVVVPGLRSACTNSLISVDYEAEMPPSYANIFETTEYVYFTFSEPALETFNSIGSQQSIYSRIARVCKNDQGQGTDQDIAYQFATLFKSRMVCGTPGVNEPLSGSYLLREYQGHYANYVNEIADASVPHISSVKGADNEEIIFAIFNSARNSMQMSAICAYKVSDINSLFNNAVDQIDFDSDMVPVTYKSSRPPAKCYGDAEQLSDDNREAVNKYLLYDTVKPLDNNALFISSVDYRMTQVQVDWQVETEDGKKYDVIFVSTDDGRLLKFVSYGQPGESSNYHLVEERDVFPGEEVREMKLIVVQGDKKHLLMNSLNQIKRVAIEKCHFYEDCASCIGLRDPYCYWSPSLSKCVSTTHTASDKYQNISSGVSPQCAGPVQNTSTTVEQKEDTTTATIIVNKPGASIVEVKEGNATFITLLVLIPVVFGVICFFGGFYYSKRRFQSPTPHIDQELMTNKYKDEPLKNDAYQDLPKQSNVHVRNNLNEKVPAADTTSTLSRQKQVYV